MHIPAVHPSVVISDILPTKLQHNGPLANAVNIKKNITPAVVSFNVWGCAQNITMGVGKKAAATISRWWKQKSWNRSTAVPGAAQLPV